MATYVNDLRLKEITTGDESGTWGTSTNTNLELIAEAFSFGTEAISGTSHDTVITDGATAPGRSMYLKYTGSLSSACTITLGPNTVSKLWIIENATSGSQNIIISQGSGANVTIANGKTKAVYTDGAGSGAAVYDAFASLDLSATPQTSVKTTAIQFTDGDTAMTIADGGGITIDTATISGTLTVPDDSIALGTKTTGNYVASLVAGTGISVGAAAEGGTPTITNTAPDQTVSLTAGSNVTISGSYPNFTIASSGGSGTVTSVATSSFLTGGTITSSGTVSVSSNFHASTSSGDNFINSYGLRFSSFPGSTEDSVIYLLDKPATTSPTSSDRYIVYDSSGSGIGVNLPGSGSFYPVGDNSDDLGKSSNRWDDIFATNNVINTSDQNEKNTIQDLSYGLNFIDQLTPRSFKYNSGSSNRTHFGLIAQEVKTVLDNNSISTDDFAAYIEPEEGPLGLRYGELIPILIKSIQELKAKVDALENA
jgi:hypothetical protein